MYNRRVPVRIAYFAEGFPTLSETWINSEIRHLIKLGACVKVFSTKDPSDLERRGNEDLIQLTERFASWPVRFNVDSLVHNFSCLRDGLTGGGAKTTRLKAQVLRDYVVTSANIQKIRAFNPDFLLAHFGGRRATLAMMAGTVLKVPFGIKYHAGDVFTESALEEDKINKAGLLMSISDYNLKVFQGRGRSTSGFVIHRCGVDLERFAVPARKDRHRERFRIVSVGRLVPMKGFDDLLNAVKLLHDRGVTQTIPLEVEIIGGGPLEGDLRTMISALSLDKVVRLLGPQEGAVISQALKEASLFVLACKATERPGETKASQSSMDGIPVALMEAMACGVPVISTHLSGIPELVSDGAEGWLVAPSSPRALASAIERAILLDQNQLLAIGLRGRQRIEKEFNAAELAADLFCRIKERLASQLTAEDATHSDWTFRV